MFNFTNDFTKQCYSRNNAETIISNTSSLETILYLLHYILYGQTLRAKNKIISAIIQDNTKIR